ncbi:MAG: hypothetical protein ACREIP_00170, partial [Alphaproteobacteria bacterium]
FKAANASPGKEAELPSAFRIARTELGDFERDLARRIADRMVSLLREARAAAQANRFDAAAKHLDEAAELEPASAELAAARRELEEARKKPQAPPDPDAAERERTRNVVGESFYDTRTRRGAAYFVFKSADLTAAASQALARAVSIAKGEKGTLTLLCSYDTLEESGAQQGRALARERCSAVERAAERQGLEGGIRIVSVSGDKGPDFRRVSFFTVQPEKPAQKAPDATKPPETAKPPEPQSRRLGAFELAGRTARLSRISAERRAVMRIELQFGDSGALAVSCSAEAADGGQSACFGQRSGSGRWSLNGTTLCVSSPVINLTANTCYEIGGSGNQISLSGPGLLAGAMFLQ